MRFLVTLDHSDRDRIALAYATRFAKATNGCAMLVHVVPRARSLVPGAIREAEAYVHAVQAGLQEAGFMTEALIVKGDPASEITRAAHKLEADLVLLVTHGRRGWDKVMLGSVAEAVLAHCKAPLVLLNEAMNHAQLDERSRMQASYLAGIIWNKRVRGLCSEDEAQDELARLANAGLDRDVLTQTYAAMAKEGIGSDWLDFEFQVDTLRKYLPDEIAALPPSHAPDEAA